MTHPEITVAGDTASGTWYLQDRVIVAYTGSLQDGEPIVAAPAEATPTASPPSA